MKRGRFLKNGSKLMKVIKLQKYSFEEISEQKLLYPDNPQGNIIHSRLHTRDDIDRGLIDPSSFKKDLERPKASIHFPTDFTQDWEEAKRRSTLPKGASQIDDQEEYEKYLESLEENKIEYWQNAEKTPPKTRREIPALDSLEEKTESTLQENIDDEKPKEEAVSKNPIEIVKDTFSKLKPETHTDEDETEPPAEERAKTPHEEQNNTAQKKEAEKQDNTEHIREQAREQGYKEGLDEALKLSQTLNDALKALQNIKKDVLSNIQDNFYEIVKALSHTIFEREVASSPYTFAKIIQKTVASLSNTDKFTVHLSPKDFQKISDLNLDALNKNIVSDEKISDGKFQIETNLGIVDAGIHNIIDQLLDQTNLNLFEKEKDSDDR